MPGMQESDRDKNKALLKPLATRSSNANHLIIYIGRRRRTNGSIASFTFFGCQRNDGEKIIKTLLSEIVLLPQRRFVCKYSTLLIQFVMHQ